MLFFEEKKKNNVPRSTTQVFLTKSFVWVKITKFADIISPVLWNRIMFFLLLKIYNVLSYYILFHDGDVLSEPHFSKIGLRDSSEILLNRTSYWKI